MADIRPLLSIGLPVFNGEKSIRQALDSLLEQDFRQFELIISDNASTDGTQEICREYAAKDNRVRYHRSDVNRGMTWNFNRVFELSSGEYFMWAAHDDFWKPQYISACLGKIQSSETVILAGTMCDFVDETTGGLIFTDEGVSTIGLSPVERYKRYRQVFSQKHIGGIFYGIYRRSALQQAMPLKKVTATDHILLANLCFLGEFYTVPERLIIKRRGGASASHRQNARAQGITNPLIINFPYLAREVFMQKAILKARDLSLAGKIKLAAWSLNDYCRGYLADAIKKLVFGMIPPFVKNPLKLVYARMKYLVTGRKPWTPGYGEYKDIYLRKVLARSHMLERFGKNLPLPLRYGFRLDERVVEYPWLLSRLNPSTGSLLDAGSSLNSEYFFDLPQLKNRGLVIFSLAQENVVRCDNVSYVYGDLRHTSFKSESFDEIVCISTIEHIGMDNTQFYTKDTRFNEFKPEDYLEVIRELRRLLKPGGKLYVTVPYGRYQNLNWLQQFDRRMVETVIKVFNGSAVNETYYRYFNDGWQISDAAACSDSSYYDIHHRSDYEPDYVAAARCVACLEMVK